MPVGSPACTSVVGAHSPYSHVAPRQSWPQAPQLCGSVVVSVEHAASAGRDVSRSHASVGARASSGGEVASTGLASAAESGGLRPPSSCSAEVEPPQAPRSSATRATGIRRDGEGGDMDRPEATALRYPGSARPTTRF